MTQGLRIGQIAEKAGVRAKTIRYYEQVGLLPEAQRNSSGYRVYAENEAARLSLISRTKLLGLSLREIKEIVGYIADGYCDSAQTRLRALIAEKIDEMDARIAELAALKVDLLQYQSELAQRIQDRSDLVESKSLSDCSCVGGKIADTREQANTKP